MKCYFSINDVAVAMEREDGQALYLVRKHDPQCTNRIVVSNLRKQMTFTREAVANIVAEFVEPVNLFCGRVEHLPILRWLGVEAKAFIKVDPGFPLPNAESDVAWIAGEDAK